MRKQAGVHLTGPQHQHGTEGDPCWITECWSWYKGKPVGVVEGKCAVRVASRKGWGGVGGEMNIRSLAEKGVLCV